MFYIVESEEQLEFLSHFKKGYIDIICAHDNVHPALSSIVAVYIRPIPQEKGYIIPVNHNEGMNIEIERVYEVLSHYECLYTIDKKSTLWHGDIKNLIDLSLLYSMTYARKLEINIENKTYTQFYHKFGAFANVNQILPLGKLYEYAEDRYQVIKDVLDLEIPAGFHFYNNIVSPVFYLVEGSGIGIHKMPFIEHFKPVDPMWSVYGDRVYTCYNLNNITSRPTNAFNSINFAAIKKDQDYRRAFKPENDMFVEFDFDGYHLRLIGDRIGYEFGEGSAHKHLACQMFNKQDITPEEYAQAKQLNFQAIYGNINKKYEHIEFYQRLQEFISELWGIYKERGYVEDPISGKRFDSRIPELTPQKLLNYYIQSLETSSNTLVLRNVLGFLRDKHTKLILYTYDALILDFSKQDGKECLEGIEKILNRKGKFPVNFTYSKDFNFK